METFRGQSNDLMFKSIGSLGNAISDGDRATVASIGTSLADTPAGNAAKIEIARVLNARAIKRAEMATAYARANNGQLDAGFDQKLDEYAAKNPLFSPADIKRLEALTGGDAAPRRGGGQPQRAAPQPPPAVGTVQGGYRFKGGNPADRNSWEPAR
jgi:hypothetical protein